MQSNHPHILPDEIVEIIKHNILISLHSNQSKNSSDEALNKKIEEQYKKYTGLEFATAENVKPLPLFLHSKPGMGKNAVFVMAASQVCELLDLKLVKNPAEDYTPKPNDFIFFSFECSHSEDLKFVHSSPDEILERMKPITLTNKGFILFEEASEAGADKKDLINMVLKHPHITVQLGLTGQVINDTVQESKTDFVEEGAQHFILSLDLTNTLDKANSVKP